MGGIYGPSDVRYVQHQAGAQVIASAINTLTEGLLKVWAPTPSIEGRKMAIALTAGPKVAEREKPPVVGVGMSRKGGEETIEILSDVESSDLDLDLLRLRGNVGKVPIHVSDGSSLWQINENACAEEGWKSFDDEV